MNLPKLKNLLSKKKKRILKLVKKKQQIKIVKIWNIFYRFLMLNETNNVLKNYFKIK